MRGGAAALIGLAVTVGVTSSVVAQEKRATATEVPIEIPQDLSDHQAFQLIVFQNTRGHLLIGNRRVDGGVPVPAIWDSADGVQWQEAPAPIPPDEATRLTLNDGVWQGDVLTVGGEQRTAAGPRAAIWRTTDTRNFAPQPEFPVGDQTSAISAMAVTDAGLLVGGWIDDGGGDRLFLSRRDAAGTWTEAQLPPGVDLEIVGMAATAATVVVTGYEVGAGNFDARALVSADGGATFTEADTSAVSGSSTSYLGAAIAVPGGFAAPACVPSDAGVLTAIARSTDGKVWSRQDITIVGNDAALASLDLHGAGCWRMVADGDTLHLGVFDVDEWVVSVRPDGTAEARFLPHQPGVVPSGPPFAIPTPQGIIAVGQASGGFIAVRMNDAVVGTGLPAPHPLLDSVDVVDTPNGLLTRVNLYPEVIDHPDGSWEWQSFGSWYATDGTSVTASDAVPPIVHQVVSASFGEIGLAYAADPADDANSGPNDGTEAYIRAPDGPWQSLGLIATGPGGDILTDLAPTTTGAVAVGTAAVRGDDNRPSWSPLIRSTNEGLGWSEQTLPLPPGAFAGLDQVCAMGDRVVALGWQLRDGVQSDMVGIRGADGAWAVVTPTGSIEGSSIIDCIADSSRIVAVAQGAEVLLVSTDGVDYQAATVERADAPDIWVHDVAVTTSGFVAVGALSDPVTRDLRATVWTSIDGADWQLRDVDGLDGLGDQTATSVTQRADGSIAIAGADDDQPTLWLIGAGVLS